MHYYTLRLNHATQKVWNRLVTEQLILYLLSVSLLAKGKQSHASKLSSEVVYSRASGVLAIYYSHHPGG